MWKPQHQTRQQAETRKYPYCTNPVFMDEEPCSSSSPWTYQVSSDTKYPNSSGACQVTSDTKYPNSSGACPEFTGPSKYTNLFPVIKKPAAPTQDEVSNEPSATNNFQLVHFESKVSSDVHLKVKHRTGKCLPFLLVIVLGAAVAGIVVAVEYLAHKGTTQEKYIETVVLDARVNETFQSDMSDNTSVTFKEFSDRFCQNVNMVLTETAEKVICYVNSLSSGSIKVKSTIQVITSQNLTQDMLKYILLNDSASDLTTWGNMTIYGQELQVMIVKTEVYQSEANSELDGNFSCSANPEMRFLPYPDTYPDQCDKHQLCRNGVGEQLWCAKGLEFAYTATNDIIVCNWPSISTYCGKLRPVKVATTTVSVETTPMSCTEDFMSHYGNLSLSSKKSCLSSVDEDFYPLDDTYPGKCDKFVWCAAGKPFNLTSPPGTHFILRNNATFAPFANINDTETYCALRKRYDACLQRMTPTTPATSTAAVKMSTT